MAEKDLGTIKVDNNAKWEEYKGGNMQPHQQRVVDEKLELDTRIESLEKFTTGKIFLDLVEEEKDRMILQLKLMKQLSEVLGERIANFPPQTYNTPTIIS